MGIETTRPPPYLSENMPNINCSECGISCYKKPSVMNRSKSGKVFCGIGCSTAHNTKWVECIICQKPIKAGLKRKTCSVACSNKNRTGINYKQTGQPKKSIVRSKEAIRLALVLHLGVEKCQRCDYEKIPDVLQVHHVVEKHKGGKDTVDNLELLCPTCHMEEHYFRRISKL